jgi:DNA-binding MltR family transcriptional regulator
VDPDIAGLWSDHFDRSISTESTRAKVVLAACYLDELLHQLLALVLKPSDRAKDPLLHGPQAPLGTYSAKIELAYRLGLLPDAIRRSLHLVRKIRNEFAHSLDDCSFSSPAIRDWSAELHRLNDVATPERRASFSPGAVGDFEKSISWLVYWLKHLIYKLPTSCPQCGSEMEHRAKIRAQAPCSTSHG